MNKQSENSEYCNFSFANKNCYLTFGSHYEEDCLYGRYSTKNKDLMDFFFMYGSELCYQSIFSSNCYKCIHIERSEQCDECLFCYDLKDCRNCLFSSNLRNKQYYIFNEPHSKEDYFEYLNKLKLSSRSQWAKLREGWLKYRKENAIFRATYQVNCENCEGSDHQNSKNLQYCFAASDCEDCAYGFQMDQTFSSIDNSHMGYDKCEICYNTIGSNGLFNGICCDSCWHSSNILYSTQCFSSKNCFGCIGMRQSEYCILNKQYSREAYEELLPKIIEHMRKTGEWGRFFPHFLRPYAYNESVAQEFYPMTKQQVLEKNWQWREKIDQDEAGAKVDIPDDIHDVDDSILDKILICEKSGRPYKIVKKELDFYRKMNLPLPGLCPAERFVERMELKNPYRLYDRRCSKCEIAIQTDIADDSVSKVYCEKCYLDFVY